MKKNPTAKQLENKERRLRKHLRTQGFCDLQGLAAYEALHEDLGNAAIGQLMRQVKNEMRWAEEAKLAKPGYCPKKYRRIIYRFVGTSAFPDTSRPLIKDYFSPRMQQHLFFRQRWVEARESKKRKALNRGDFSYTQDTRTIHVGASS